MARTKTRLTDRTAPDARSKISAEAKKLIAEQRIGLFLALCKREGVAEPEREVKFAKPVRNWRFDLGWCDAKVALEIEGGAWSGGRHTRGAGFIEDMAKYNYATSLGWQVYRVTPAQLDTLATVHMIRAAIQKP